MGIHQQMPTMWIQLEGEDEINVADICSGLMFLQDRSSPVITNSYQTNTGSDGSLFNYTNYSLRTEYCDFYLDFEDWYDLTLKKHEIYRYFNSQQQMRIRTDTEPGTVKYVRANSFDITPNDGELFVKFTVVFDNPSGYKYSLANSDELMTYDTGVWQLYGQNIPNGQDIGYSFSNQTTLNVYNASDIAIDPYRQSHELLIEMSVNSSNSGFKLSNPLNGTSWRYTGSLTSSDALEINGLNTFKNGNLDNNNTDFGYLKLEKGWNPIQVQGTNDLSITFSFPFIYID